MKRQRESEERTCRLLAYDKRANQYLGAVAELSPTYLVLLADTPVQPDRILEVHLQCANQQLRLDGMYLGVRVLWNEPREDAYWVGMQIISVDQKDKHRLAKLPRPQAIDERRIESLTA